MLTEMYMKGSGSRIEQTDSEYSLMSTAMLSLKATGWTTYSTEKGSRRGANLGNRAPHMSVNFSRERSKETVHSSGKMVHFTRETSWMVNFKALENTTLQI